MVSVPGIVSQRTTRGEHTSPFGGAYIMVLQISMARHFAKKETFQKHSQVSLKYLNKCYLGGMGVGGWAGEGLGLNVQNLLSK